MRAYPIAHLQMAHDGSQQDIGEGWAGEPNANKQEDEGGAEGQGEP